MSCRTLPGIRKIEIVRCADLQAGVMLHSICGCVVAVTAPSEKIDYSGRATLQWEGTKVNGGRQEKSTLEFTTIHHLPEGVNLAFVVTTADGLQYLIGSREGRFPKIEYNESAGEPGRTAAARTYKISHIAQKSVLRCIM